MKERTRIETLSALAAPSGREDRVREQIRTYLLPLCDTVYTDVLGNLIGVRRCGKPNAQALLLDAHMDEVGLIVMGIENGFLRFAPLGGIDPRILPATEVFVLAEEPLFGVIDTLPPHMLSGSDMDKAVPMEDLVIDIGLSQEEAEACVPLGTAVAFAVEPARLQNGRMCGKSLDNRACVEILLRVMENLRDTALDMDVYCMFSTQEEPGTRGAVTGVYGISPQYALILDVTHAKTPDAQSIELMEMGGGSAVGVGPNMTYALTKKLIQIAKEEEIPYQMEVMSGSSGTNAWPIQISREGVATGVVSLPLRYMHTPNEVIDMADVEAVERLVTAFVRRFGEESV